MASLVVDHSKVRSERYELLGDVTTIGRDPSNNVVIDDPTVSARHASLTKSSTGYRLTDLGSTNGTRYNGALVSDAELKDGDEIQFGSVTAVFRDGRRSDQTEKFRASVEHPSPALADASSRWSFSRKSATVAVGALIAISISTWSVIVRHQTERPSAATQTFDLVTLAKKTRNAVMLIDVFDSDRKEIASGSGFFVSADGLLITNLHVIDGAANAAAKTESGDLLPIKGVVKFDQENDLALLAVEGNNLPFLSLGGSENLQAGDHVAVIGSPLGLEGSLSEGIVSAKRGDGQRRLLQITAPISPGSSGSPVLDSSGKVIGIARAGMRDGQSVNFAVPAELAAAMLHGQKPTSPLPLETFARFNALTNDAAESAVSESAEYQQVTRALLKATAAAAGASIGLNEHADWAKVLNAAKALVAKYPSSGVAHAKLGDVYDSMGVSEEAIEAYQRAVKLNPDQPLTWKTLGLIYKKRDEVTQADFAFQQAIAFETSTVQSQPSGKRSMPLFFLGDIYQSAENNEAAEKSYLQAIQEEPNGVGALMSLHGLAATYLSRGNEKAALDIAYQIVLLNPNHKTPQAEAWEYLSSWYCDHHRDDDCDRCYRNAQGLGLQR